MDVLFLDIDGVLNSSKSLKASNKDTPTRAEEDFVVNLLRTYYTGYPYCTLITDLLGLEPTCIQNLNLILKATDARVVLSSTWRFSHHLIGLTKLLEYRGFKGFLFDITPINLIGEEVRGREIQAWLDLHPGVDRFIILDDNKDMAHLKSHLVLTDRSVGLTKKDAQRAISILLAPVRPVRT